MSNHNYDNNKKKKKKKIYKKKKKKKKKNMIHVTPSAKNDKQQFLWLLFL